MDTSACSTSGMWNEANQTSVSSTVAAAAPSIGILASAGINRQTPPTASHLRQPARRPRERTCQRLFSSTLRQETVNGQLGVRRYEDLAVRDDGDLELVPFVRVPRVPAGLLL